MHIVQGKGLYIEIVVIVLNLQRRVLQAGLGHAAAIGADDGDKVIAEADLLIALGQVAQLVSDIAAEGGNAVILLDFAELGQLFLQVEQGNGAAGNAAENFHRGGNELVTENVDKKDRLVLIAVDFSQSYSSAKVNLPEDMFRFWNIPFGQLNQFEQIEMIKHSI